MSADGEITVAVNAEGVDDATGELEPPPTGGGGGGDGGGGGVLPGRGGGDGGGRGLKSLTKPIAGILALLSVLQPILDLIKPIANILRAFVAPLAVLLLRLLQPVLALLLQTLPVFFDFVERIDTVVSKLSPLTKVAALIGVIAGGLAGAKVGAVVGAIVGGFLGSVVPGFGTAVGAAVGAKVGAIVGGIVGGVTGGVTLAAVEAGVKDLSDRISDFLGGLTSADSAREGAVRTADQATDTPGLTESAGGLFGIATQAAGGGESRDLTNVVINGGLAPFVDEITRDGSTDLF